MHVNVAVLLPVISNRC